MIKQTLDERVKHRLIGVVVVVSLVIIFLPALIKQSNQRFDDNSNLSFRLPKKPVLPQVAIIDKNHMFKEAKVATVTIPPMAHAHIQVSKAVPLSLSNEANASRTSTTTLAQTHSQPAVGPRDFFTIQLATFTQETNAQALVSRLRNKGFPASSQIIKNEQGSSYQVIVGQLKQRDQAIDLQKRLVNNTQLNGLIIKTKVS